MAAKTAKGKSASKKAAKKPAKSAGKPKPAKPAPRPAPKPVSKAAPKPTPKPAPVKVPAKVEAKPPPPQKPAPTPIVRPMAPVIKPGGKEKKLPATVTQPPKTLEAAPLPPPSHAPVASVTEGVHPAMVSAVTYGLFAAINKSFGFHGQSVMKHAALRILEFGQKRGWLPTKSREPIKGLQEFLNRLVQMGYAEKVSVKGVGNEATVEVTGLADWDAVLEIRHLGYPLVPVLTPELVATFLDTQFKMATALQPLLLEPERRGVTVKFNFVPKESLVLERVQEAPKLVIEEE